MSTINPTGKEIISVSGDFCGRPLTLEVNRVGFRTTGSVLVRYGETVVLGGIIQREQSDVQRKVPGLGSIPGLGWAFKKKDKALREVELMVFLQPRITRTPEQAKELLREVERKVPLIKNWEEDRPAVKPGKVEEEQQKNALEENKKS